MLNNWSLHVEQNPYKAPEVLTPYLSGTDETGEQVQFIVDFKDFNPKNKTLSGHELGGPHPEYLYWLQQHPPEEFGKNKPDPIRDYAMSYVK